MRFKIFILALGCVVLATFSVQRAYAEVEGMSVEIKGMMCGYCANKAESGLKRIDWIKSAHVDPDASAAHIMVEKGKSIYIDKLHEAVRETGFTPVDVKITATGALTAHNERPALKVSGSEQVFLLIAGNKDETISELDGKILREIEAASENSSTEISITGVVTSNSPNDPQYLSVEKFSVDKFEAAGESRP